MTQYRIRFFSIAEPTITYLETEDFLSLSYSLNANDVTELRIRLVPGVSVPELNARTMAVRMYRKADGASAFDVEGSTDWLVSRISHEYNENGLHTQFISAAHPNLILKRRVVGYPSGTEQADRTLDMGTEDVPTEIMASIVAQNMGAEADPDRQLLGLIISKPAIVLPVTEAQLGYRNVLSSLQDLAQELDENSDRSYFALTINDSVPTFTIKKGFLGTDRSASVFFGIGYDNIESISAEVDYGRELNMVYAGGEGSGEDQWIVPVIDSTRIPHPFCRAEEYESFGDIDDESVLEQEGERFLRMNRAKRVIRANVANRGLFLYGRDYHHGDRVTLSLNGVNYPSHIYAISVTYEFPKEEVEIAIEAEGDA